MKYFLTLLLILAAAYGQADDHGNVPSMATLLPTGSTGLTAAIDTDLDVDWFRFVAAPTMVYTVKVTGVTLWDSDYNLKTFADSPAVRSTNTAFVTSAGTIIWTNQGGVRSYYVGVGGLFEFTTGTYVIVANGNDADGDGDGMADAWEMSMFSTLTNGAAGDVDGDQVSNFDEYLAGTHPNLAASRLAVTNLVPGVSGTAVGWPGTSLGSYVVEGTTNLASSAAWTFLSRVIRDQSSGPTLYLDPAGTNQVRHYRVRYEY